MKKLILFLCVIAAACATWHQAEAGTSVWDFEKPDLIKKDWKFVSGKWDVKGGVLAQEDLAFPAMRAFVGDPKWTDYTVEAKIRSDQGNWFGVIFRAKSDLEYYIFYMGVSENVVELWRHMPPNPDSRANIFKNAPNKTAIKAATWHDVKIIVDGDRFQLFLDGQLQDDLKDPNYKEGRIGAWAWQTKASFDNFKITGKDIPDNLAVEPAGKLSVVWGRMKER
jgi:hypothetical protein